MTFLNKLFSVFQLSQRSDIFTRYIALGDSMSTDDYPGEGKGVASLLYMNRDDLYPEFHGQDLKHLYPGIQFQNLAMDGATTTDVLHDQLTTISASPSEKILFTLSCGGNDILTGEDADQIVARIGTITSSLMRNFPHSELFITTIYDPTDGKKDLLEEGIEMTREFEILEIVNEAIRSLEKNTRIHLVDVYSEFLGHGSQCKDESNRYYNIEDPSLWYVLKIEPNARGAHEIRRLTLEKVMSAE